MRPSLHRKPNTSRQKENPHPALWRFYRILNGHGIQDDWTAPAPHIDVDESARTYPTNIRIFDDAQGQWAMAWIGSMNRTLQTFTATSTEDQLVMNSIGVDPHGETSFTTCHPLGSAGARNGRSTKVKPGHSWPILKRRDGTIKTKRVRSVEMPIDKLRRHFRHLREDVRGRGALPF